jgi:hypothetical protein
MLYSIFCYHDETAVARLSRDEDAALMEDLAKVRASLEAEGKIGPTARLMPTTAATTLRFGGPELVTDGPFAETKEQLLGFYVVECASLEDALDVARRLAVPRAGAGLSGALEVRPVLFAPGLGT